MIAVYTGLQGVETGLYGGHVLAPSNCIHHSTPDKFRVINRGDFEVHQEIHPLLNSPYDELMSHLQKLMANSAQVKFSLSSRSLCLQDT